MRNTVATICARVGIAALASLGVLAVPAGAASASPAQEIVVAHNVFVSFLTPAECAALQQQIDTINVRVLTLQEMLETAPPSQKAGIIQQILRLEKQGSILQSQYDAGCSH
jgi:hypothetical protein